MSRDESFEFDVTSTCESLIPYNSVQQFTYSLTPHGSQRELNNVRRPNSKEDYHRLSQQFLQYKLVTNAPVEVNQSKLEFYRETTYLKYALLSFILCFPLGIIAIIKSLKAKRELNKKNKEVGKDYADAARFYATLAVMFGLLVITIATALRLRSMFENDSDSFFNK